MKIERDEGRVRVGTVGHVHYLGGGPIECTVRRIIVNPRDGHLYAECEEESGDTRWFRLDEVHTTQNGD